MEKENQPPKHGLDICLYHFLDSQFIFYFNTRQGYLYSSTVDYLTKLQPALSYTWVLMTIGWLLPNMVIAISHASLAIQYR